MLFKVLVHKGSEVYTAEPDIPEPSLIEIELAIENLKKHKAPGVGEKILLYFLNYMY